MKQILIIVTSLTVIACSIGPGKARIEAAKQSEATGNPRPYTPVEVTEPRVVLAWGTSHPDWDKALYEAIDNLKQPHNGSPVKLKTPCKKLDTRDCAAQLLSAIAKRESGFDPSVKYNETGHLQGVVSRGLFQISKDSANQSAYNCNIGDAKDLHDPKINIQCAVKILGYQALKTGTLIDGEKGGCGAYWSVCRSKNGKSESYKFIMNYMSQF